jgi:CDP-diacylglycerol---serine O-phosphatidyltransferase
MIRVTRSIVPNLFTLVNLFMGFSAIVYTSKDDYFNAAVFILVAAIFDMLDGLMARLLKAASEFGVELDSLCDAVSFGVAPAYMLYRAYFHTLGDFGILLASLPALTGVMRLARFNVKVTSFEDKYYFTGMAIPSGALTIISYLLFYHLSNIIPEESKPVTIIAVTIITSLVMVSRIKFDNVPRIRNIKQKPIIFALFVIGLLGSIFSKGYFIFPFMIFYIVASSIRHFIRWLKETREATDDIDENEHEEPSPYQFL